MNRTINLTVNGNAVSATVEPRLQLAEFVREHLFLTGTHLGCEHGVCGACTLEIDGAPARSCITYAVACNGVAVRTIEGFDDDAVMNALRDAFSAEHALQCGYCTPGMLVTARDIVLRLPEADEARIRKELAGNLCRCTGYVGIVRAIERVLADRRPAAQDERQSFEAANGRTARSASWPDRTLPPRDVAGPPAVLCSSEREPRGDAGAPPPASKPRAPTAVSESTASGQTLHESFVVDYPRAALWEFFGRPEAVTGCLPGASVIGTPTENHIDLALRVKLGPIVAEFQGQADITRDPATYTGRIEGAARDVRSTSRTRGTVRYTLLEERGGTATRVNVAVNYAVTGALAQFGRSGLMQDIAKRLTVGFAANLQARLEGSATAGTPSNLPATELRAGSLLLSVLWQRVKALFQRK